MSRFTALALGLAVLSVTPATLADTPVGGTISANTVWSLANSPYLVTSPIYVGATLTIEPGVTVKFQSDSALLVGTTFPGTLIARGTPESKITFTTAGTPQPGAWSRLIFANLTTDAAFDAQGNYLSGSILEHVIVESAGYANQSAVRCDTAAPYFSSCLIRDCLGDGIEVVGYSMPAIRINACEITGCVRAINLQGGSGHRVLSCNLHHNANGVYAMAADVRVEGNTISDNNASGLNGRPAAGAGLDLHGEIPVIINNTIERNVAASQGAGLYFAGSSVTLTGNTFRANIATSNYGGAMRFCSSGGHTISSNVFENNTAPEGAVLFGSISDSTVSDNTFTANQATGNGGAFNLLSAGYNTFTNNTFLQNHGSLGGAIYLSGSGNTWTDNTFRENHATANGGAIYLFSCASERFKGNRIIANTTDGPTGGVVVAGASTNVALDYDPPTGKYNTICDNGGYEIENATSPASLVDAVGVWWCTTSSPTIQAGIYDTQDDPTRGPVSWILPVEPPSLVSAVSRQPTTGGNIDTPLHLVNPTISSRGLGEVVFTFSESIATASVQVLCDGCAGLPVTGVRAGNQFKVQTIRGLPDQVCVTYKLIGVTDSNGLALAGDDDIRVVLLNGDANQNGIVNLGDVLYIRSRLWQTVDASNAILDLDWDGRITPADFQAAKASIGHSAACP